MSGYSDQDINMALQGSKFDEKDYARLTGNTLGDGNDNEETTTNPALLRPEAAITVAAVLQAITVLSKVEQLMEIRVL